MPKRHDSWMGLVLLVLLASVAAASCGYRPLLGGGKEPVAVPVVANETSFAGLSEVFTTELRRRLASFGVPVSAGGENRDRLETTITDVSGAPGALAPQDGRLTAVAEDWRVSARAVLKGHDGEVVWESEDLEEAARRPVAGGVVGAESLADAGRKEACSRLAGRIALAVLEHLR